jgi:hypothetical protein
MAVIEVNRKPYLVRKYKKKKVRTSKLYTSRTVEGKVKKKINVSLNETKESGC